MSETNAPNYVEAVTMETIQQQRDKGWPDIHPEDFCQRCGRRNIVWHTDRWYEAEYREGGGILCPPCFARRWELLHPDEKPIWELSIHRATVWKKKAKPPNPESETDDGWSGA